VQVVESRPAQASLPFDRPIDRPSQPCHGDSPCEAGPDVHVPRADDTASEADDTAPRAHRTPSIDTASEADDTASRAHRAPSIDTASPDDARPIGTATHDTTSSTEALPPLEALSAELEAALLRELRACYDSINWAHFRERLRPPVIVLSDAGTFHGRWIGATRRLELSRRLVLARPWVEVLGVLEHEMAHQYVHEILRVTDETAHGDAFRAVCTEHGFDARAAGAPVPSTATIADVDRVLDRIRKRLALAGSPNQHEAETAMRKAHELMLRYNIDAVAAAGASADRSYCVRHLGDPTKRITRVEAEIAALLAEFFFVKVIQIPVYVPHLGKRGTQFEVSGTRANVEMAAHVHAFLLATAERLWQANRSDARVRSGRDRLVYQSGVIGGFRDKLAGERKQLRGTGLVWVGDADLDRFYHARHPRITTRRRMVRTNAAHAAGREAGRKVVLHKPVESSSSSGRALPPGRRS
jgi:uncharacterized protein DUF2786/SprT-like family protein